MNSSVSWRVLLSCSGRLSFNLLRSISLFLLSRRRIDRFVYYPSDSSLASCTTTFCLCKSCQRTLSFCLLSSGVWYRFPESECKSTAFSWFHQIFHAFFSEKLHFSTFEWLISRQIGNMQLIWAERCEINGFWGNVGDSQLIEVGRTRTEWGAPHKHPHIPNFIPSTFRCGECECNNQRPQGDEWWRLLCADLTS